MSMCTVNLLNPTKSCLYSTINGTAQLERIASPCTARRVNDSSAKAQRRHDKQAEADVRPEERQHGTFEGLDRPVKYLRPPEFLRRNKAAEVSDSRKRGWRERGSSCHMISRALRYILQVP